MITYGQFLWLSLQEQRIHVGAVDLDVTGCAVLVSRIPNVMERGRLRAKDAGRVRVTFETKLLHLAPLEHLGIIRAMWFVTDHTTFQPDRRVLEGEWALFFCVTLEANGIGATRRRACLGGVEAAMRIVTIIATHAFFVHPMMERALEFLFDLAMTLIAERRAFHRQQFLFRFGRMR